MQAYQHIQSVSKHPRKELLNKYPEHTISDLYNKPVLSTGLKELDRILPYGGLPVGEFIELVGGPSSGKTTLLL